MKSLLFLFFIALNSFSFSQIKINSESQENINRLIIQEKNIPLEAFWQNKNRNTQTVLIYNQHKNKQHSFILMTK